MPKSKGFQEGNSCLSKGDPPSPPLPRTPTHGHASPRAGACSPRHVTAQAGGTHAGSSQGLPPPPHTLSTAISVEREIRETRRYHRKGGQEGQGMTAPVVMDS